MLERTTRERAGGLISLEQVRDALGHMAHLEKIMISIASIEFGILAYAAANVGKLKQAFAGENDDSILFVTIISACTITAIAHLHYARIHLALGCCLLDLENNTGGNFQLFHNSLIVSPGAFLGVGGHLYVGASWLICILYATLVLSGAVFYFGHILNITFHWRAAIASALLLIAGIYIFPVMKELLRRLRPTADKERTVGTEETAQ